MPRLRLKFPPSPRSGAYPIQMSDVGMAFDDKTIFSGVNLTVERGDKIAFVGRNGEGKSTLVKCIMGQLKNTGRDTVVEQRPKPAISLIIARRGTKSPPL